MRFFYLSTPYAKYPLGRRAAYLEAQRNAALLLAASVTVFCPIAHSHPMIEAGLIPRPDWAFWSCIDEDMLRSSAGLIVCQMQGWEDSIGVQAEINWAHQAALPEYYMTPGEVDDGLKAWAALRHKVNF